MRGFTLAEVLIVVAIGIVLAVAAIPFAGNVYTGAQLSGTTSEFMQTLRLARAMSVSGLGDEPHGVYVEADKYTLYRGESWVLRFAQYDQVHKVDAPIRLSTNILGGDIHFSEGLGQVAETGSVTITHDTRGEANIVNINSGGFISL